LKHPAKPILLALLLLGLLGVALLAFSSATATECVAHIKGGSGTVEDPMRIVVEGNAGLFPFIDSLLPFRGIPSIQLSYAGERFYVPGLNPFFAEKQVLAKILYLLSLVLFLAIGTGLLLRLAGKKVVLVDRHPEEAES